MINFDRSYPEYYSGTQIAHSEIISIAANKKHSIIRSSVIWCYPAGCSVMRLLSNVNLREYIFNMGWFIFRKLLHRYSDFMNFTRFEREKVFTKSLGRIESLKFSTRIASYGAIHKTFKTISNICNGNLQIVIWVIPA